MRVIGGAYRGRRLFAPEGADTRPTAARVREALFDILQGQMEGATFLDLYAGTGAVGIEALSRGAARALFVERAGSALHALRRNLEAVGAAARAEVLPMGAERAISLLAGRAPGITVAFVDPPYAAAERDRVLEALAAPALWAPSATLVVEHGAREAPRAPAGFDVGRDYRYGDTRLSLFHRAGEAAP